MDGAAFSEMVSEWGERIRDVYFSLEDRYYDFLDGINDRIPIYSIIDPIDRLVPSFLILCLVLFLLLAGILVWVFGGFFAAPNTLGILKVIDLQQNPVSGITLQVHLDGQPFPMQVTTNNSGIARFDLTKPSIRARIQTQNIPGFLDFEETILLTASKTKNIQLQPIQTAEFSGTYVLRFKDSKTQNVITDQTLLASFRCEPAGSAPPTQPTTTGQLSIQKDSGCATLYANVEALHSYEPASNIAIVNSPQDIFLHPKGQVANGLLEVKVVDANTNPVSSAHVTVSTQNQPVLNQGITQSSGKTTFELAPGTYHIIAFVPADGRNAEQDVTLSSDEIKKITLDVGNPLPNAQKIFLKIVDKNNQQPLSQVQVKIYQNTNYLITKQSASDGIVTQPIQQNPGQTFSAIVFDPGYLLKVIPQVTLKSATDQNPAIVQLEKISNNPKNYGEALAMVSSQTNPKVTNANVYIYRTDYPNPLLGPYLSNTEGVAVFSNLPPSNTVFLADEPNQTTAFFDAGTPAPYFVKAAKDQLQGTSEQKTIATGEQVEFPVVIVPPQGRFHVTVTDFNSNQPVNQAVILAFQGQNNPPVILDTNITNANGEYWSPLLYTTQTVFFGVSKNGYLSYLTIGHQPVANQTIDINILLIPQNAIDANIFMLFKELRNSNNQIPTLMESGKRYKAVFVLGLGQNIQYYDVNAHVEDGNHNWLDANQNDSVIVNATSNPNSTRIFSSHLNPANPFSNPLPVNSETASRQVNFSWDQLNQGTYEFSVDFNTNANLPLGTEILLYYQAQALAPLDKSDSQSYLQKFEIGAAACGQNCPTFAWQFWYSKQGENNFQPVPLSAPRAELAQNQLYQIKYLIHNFTQTTFNADFLVDTDPSDFLETDHNSFDNQSMVPGAFQYGDAFPLEVFTVSPGNFHEIEFRLDTIPQTLDDSNKKSIFFDTLGGKPLDVTYAFPPASPQSLEITITDHTTGALIENATVVIQKSCANPNSFQFNPQDGTFQIGITSSDGTILFLNYPIFPNECINVGAFAFEYVPKKIQIPATQSIGLAKDFECVFLDADASTDPIENQRNAERQTNAQIKIISQNCQAADVSITTLCGNLFANLMGQFNSCPVTFSGSGFDPNNFLLPTNTTKTITVNITNNAPLGFIPIIALVKKPSENWDNVGLKYASFVEFIVVPRESPLKDGIGIVEGDQ